MKMRFGVKGNGSYIDECRKHGSSFIHLLFSSFLLHLAYGSRAVFVEPQFCTPVFPKALLPYAGRKAGRRKTPYNFVTI